MQGLTLHTPYTFRLNASFNHFKNIEKASLVYNNS